MGGGTDGADDDGSKKTSDCTPVSMLYGTGGSPKSENRCFDWGAKNLYWLAK